MVISKSQALEISIRKLPLARAPVLPLRQHGPLTHLPMLEETRVVDHESHDKRQNWTRISGNVRKSFTSRSSSKFLQNKLDISHKLPLNYHSLGGDITYHDVKHLFKFSTSSTTNDEHENPTCKEFQLL